MRYIVGLGNHLLRDDSVGLRLAEELAAMASLAAATSNAPEFEILVLRGGGLELLPLLDQQIEKILFLDCTRGIGEPGQYRIFGLGEVTSKKFLPSRSTHEGDLLRLIDAAGRLNYPLPRMRILGIEPADTSFGEELSPELRARFTDYLAEATAQIRSDDW